MILTPTTELEAVNIMLGTIGQSPISVLPSASESNALVDAVVAESVLREIARDVLQEGWHFNTNIDYAIAPDVSGYINVPTNTLSLELTKYFPTQDVTLRGVKMWDRENNTYVFTETLKFNIIMFLDLIDLPEPARRYITIRAARTFQDRQFGSDTIHVYTTGDEDRARANIEREEHRSAKHNILDDAATGEAIVRR
jgi:hypothetical protein